MKKFLFAFFRTLLMFIICITVILFSGRIIDFFPAIIKIPIILFLLQTIILLYFSISSYDIISTILGIVIALMSVIFNIINIINQLSNIFMIIIYLLSTIFIIIQTIHCIGIRYNNGFRE